VQPRRNSRTGKSVAKFRPRFSMITRYELIAAALVFDWILSFLLHPSLLIVSRVSRGIDLF
jgi:hypothetical protein